MKPAHHSSFTFRSPSPPFVKAAALLIGLALHATAAHALNFQGFGVRPIQPVEISADGSVVVGYSYTELGIGVFRWTSAGGMTDLGVEIGDHNLTSKSYNSGSLSVSVDGSVVAGTRYGVDGYEPFRWTVTDGMAYLGILPGTAGSFTIGLSADGSTLFGSSHIPISMTPFEYSYEVFRWTSADGIVRLGALPRGPESEATGISADGSVIVGAGYTLVSTSPYGFGAPVEAFRWTPADGMAGFGEASFASGVSADGSVVVGSSNGEAFRWTSTDGMVGLGMLPGGDWSHASHVSADGSVVVGTSSRIIPGSGIPTLFDDLSVSSVFHWTSTEGMVAIGSAGDGLSSHLELIDISGDGSVVLVDLSSGIMGHTSYVWDSNNGTRTLDALLMDSEIDISGWEDLTATALSADGTALIGTGVHNGYGEAWLITGLAVPEPGTVALLIAGGLWMLLGLHKRRPVQEPK